MSSHAARARSGRAEHGFAFAALAMAALMVPAAARAATCTWLGGGNGQWGSAGGNWSGGACGGGPPNSNDSVVFSGSGTANCTITGNVSVASISINSGYTGTVTQNSGVTITTSGAFTQAAGTFAGGNGTIDIGGNFTLSGGAFTSTSGRLEIAGAFGKTGGTFSHNSGQVMLNATSSQTFASGGATFYDLTINDGLAGYWKLDEGSGTSASDASGYGRTAALQSSPSWSTTGLASLNFRNPAALALNGSSQYGSVGAAVTNTTAAFTACVWVKFSSLSGAHTMLSEPGTNTSAFILKRDSGGKFGFLMTSADVAGPTMYQTLGTTTAVTGTWYHVCGTYNGSNTATLYVNGSAEGTPATVSAEWPASNTYIGAARWAGAVVDHVPGTLDDVRIYSRALSATEIGRLYAGGQPQTGLATQTLTGTPTVSHDLVIASGTLAGGTNALSVGGSWWNYGGLYSGTGTVTFIGSATSNTILSGGQSFGPITVSGSGTWTLADALSAPTRAIAVNSGTLAGLSYSIRAGSITKSGSGTFTPGTGTVTLDGSSNVTIPGGSYGGLTIDTADSNLVGHWKLDEGSGTSFSDSSGYGNTGTLVNGPTWSTDVSSTIRFGDPRSLSIAGGSTNDHGVATVSSLGLNPNSGVTVAYWMYYPSVPTDSQSAVTLKSSGLLQTGFRKNWDTCVTACLAAWNSGGGLLAYKTGPSASGWHHLAYTWDGSNSRIYIDGTEATGTTNAPTSSVVSTLYLSTYDGSGEDFTGGKIDDVRVYNTALTATQVQRLASGYSSYSTPPTYTLGGHTTVTGAIALTSGGIVVGSHTLTASAGLTVGGNGTLTMATSGGALAIGSGQSLIMDGTLNASSTGATIRSTSGSYTFKVGSTSTARPTLNITGLAVQDTDTNGMWINSNTSAVTTFTRFDNIAFSSGATGGNLLQIYAPSLNLVSNGSTFDASTAYTVKLVGDGFTTEATQTRAVFGSATCAAGSCQGTKSDDDPNNDGVPTAASGGAVVQFVSNAPTDTAGTIVGFPTAAFSWNDGSWYATYVAFNSASGTAGTVYVRDTTGAPRYSWSTPASETIVSTPRWSTEGTGVNEKHYLFVALASGKVYRLLDNGSSLAPDSASPGWSTTNPFDCGCTITTPIAMDYTNLYWAGQRTSDSTYRVWAVGQADQSVPGWSPIRPSAVSSPTTSETAVTSASLAFWTSGSTYLFLGQSGYLVKANISTGTVAEYNSNPGAGRSILGRIMVVGSGTNRVLAGDDGGSFWSIAPGTFTGTNRQWGYTTLAGTDQFRSTPIYDHPGGYVHFGSEGGRLIVLDASTGSPLTGYPMTSLTTDPMRSAILYRSGVVAVGTTTGKLFFVNRRTTSDGTPILMKQYYFGSTQQVSGIAFDSASNRYLVSTSGSSADGRLFTIAADSTLTDTDGSL